MNPIIITSDLQLSANERDEYRFEFIEHTLPKLLHKHKATKLYVLGDLTEEKDKHGADLVNRIVNAFYQLVEQAHIVVLKGNHDYVGSSHPFFHFLQNSHRIHFITEPRLIEKHLFLPHTNNYKQDWPKIFRGPRLEYIFAHQTFAGAMAANGFEMGGIPTSILPKGVPVIAGDVHTPQSNGQVTYVGAPYLCDFGDDYEPRVLKLEGNKITSIPLKGPQKRLIVTDQHGIIHNPVDANPGDILKIRVAIKQDQYAKWPEIRKTVRDVVGEQGMLVYAVEPMVIKERGQQRRQQENRNRRQSDEQLLRDHAKRERLDERTTKMGLELL